MMKKLGKVLVVAVLVSVTFSGCGGCGKKAKIERLQSNLNDVNGEVALYEEQLTEANNQLADANARADAAEQKAASVVEDETYMQLKFPYDGNYYKEAYDEVVFYSDCTCTQIIENVRFMSPEVDNDVVAPNGLEVSALKMDNGKICYCPRSANPYLITEECYNELKAEEEAKAAEEETE